MRDRGVKTADVARATGLSLQIVYEYTSGRYLPRLEQAQLLSDALMCPVLVKIAKDERYRKCALATCHRPFWRHGPQKFCSSACRILAEKGVSTRSPNPAQDAIDEMCRSCEPDGICRNDGCPLRSFSPLKFSPMTDVSFIGDPEVAARRAKWRAKWHREHDKVPA
jgi:transcriptional regulator with XRE-family HTH domain